MKWTVSPAAAPDEPAYIEIRFDEGIPTAVDGETMAGVALIGHLNELAGAHGIGRIDHVENRLVGIKSREIYESPAGVLLHSAHRALETMTLSREQSRFKERIAQEYAELVYNGLWYTEHRRDLDAYVDSTQRHVSGRHPRPPAQGFLRGGGADGGSCPCMTTAWQPTTAPTNSTTPQPRALLTSTACRPARSGGGRGNNRLLILLE